MTALFDDAQSRLTDVMQHIELSDDVLERLQHPKLALTVSIPLRMDDGSLRVFTGYRVQFDETRGPTKGGIAVNPKELSRLELERLSRGYIRAVADVIGPKRDIPAPDVYTNATIMGWMANEYDQIMREQLPGVITGKPVHLGGSLGREAATGQGAL